MTDFLSAGVYPVEVDASPSVQSASTSTLGIVGVFERGPVGVPTLVTSMADAQAKFGAFIDASGYFGMLALNAYFANGGGRAYVVRTVHYAAGVAQGAASTIQLQDRNATPANTLKVSAASVGAWGDRVSVTVTDSVAYPTTGFNLTVKQDGVVVETWADLLIGATNIASDDYVEKRINGVSAYIVVTDDASATAAPANRPALATTSLASGNDGLTGLVSSDYIGLSSAATGLYALDTVDVQMVAIPGQGNSTIAGDLAVGLITYVEARKDAIALIEAPAGSTRDQLIAFRTGATPWTHAAFNSSYAALFGPGVIATHPVTGRDVTLPPAAVAAGLTAANDSVGAVWTAAAGLTRGVVKGAKGPALALSKGDRDSLYSNNINPICIINGSLVVWGFRTLALKFSKLTNLEVRRTMCFIESSANRALNTLVFEPDNPKTMDAVIRLLNPFLRGVRDGGGLLDFKVICDTTLNPGSVTTLGILKTRILVKPVGSAQFLPVEYVITADGTDFSEL